MEGIEYSDSRPVSPEEYTALLETTTLGERRPLDDPGRVALMLRNASLTITAWRGGELVGIARTVTDLAYCCYLSDLAVRGDLQRQGIGRELIRQVQRRLHPKAKIILLAAPQARGYYPRLGFTQHGSAWTLGASEAL
ncbi:MAG: GNAT family N-acetyltransferase [Succinivibrionaceae bacterium]|nr:GNAT family N-acetyltransferase [Succinivibrionaceae bacterium]